jgi:2-polyprenyl-6-hydroxyphenyl methylase/3-demethylubiquinone-9 3-methyltransferase
MSSSTQFIESKYIDRGISGAFSYTMRGLLSFCPDIRPGTRILDVGCGNGLAAAEFAKLGCTVVGIDLAEAGIRFAHEACPTGRFELLPADSNVLENLGEAPFDIVYSLEVIEHLYDPRSFLAGCFAATKCGGRFICSTPYHGYLKNLTIALVNGWDKHLNPGHDGGHIKFFSRKSLSALLIEAGFHNLQFRGLARVPYLWKSMIVSGTRQ